MIDQSALIDIVILLFLGYSPTAVGEEVKRNVSFRTRPGTDLLRVSQWKVSWGATFPRPSVI